MADAEELSLEETNRLRIQAGLAPLGEETEGVIDEDQVAYDNFQKLKEEKEKEKKAKDVMERIEKAKNRMKATEKLKGKGLAEASDDEESALKWIKKSRKREKELAEKRARELAEMDKTFEAARYDSADLTGLKVAHDLTEFEDGGEVILTLKDTGVLDEEEEGIQLTNVNLEERERHRKNIENKKKKPGYNVYDDEEFTIGGSSKGILSQYDEELEGPKKFSFVIGQEGRVGQTASNEKATVAEKLKAQAVDLKYEKMQEVKDYYTQEEAELKFKKPKKKKKVRRKAAEPQEDEQPVENGQPNETMAVDEPAAAPAKKTFDDENFVDDDDLQQALARTRRIAIKKKQPANRMTPEDIARNIAQQRDTVQQDDAADDGDAGGLVISDTSEFVNSLSMEPVLEREQQERERMQTEAEAQAAAVVTEMQLDNEDVEMESEEPQEAEVADSEIGNGEDDISAVVDEPLVSRGMAATLALLNQKGFIAKPSDEQLKKDKQAAERSKWIAEQKRKDLQQERERERERLRDKQRDRERGRDRGGRDYEREREHEREMEKERKERERMKEYEQRMKDYKPDVNIEYTDEFGKVMTPKEAYRVLSHKFHGKTSGKAKTEKRLRKMQEELALNSMGSSDTPHNLAAAMIDRQEKTGSAHFVLSVGNRGVLPGDEANANKKRKTE